MELDANVSKALMMVSASWYQGRSRPSSQEPQEPDDHDSSSSLVLRPSSLMETSRMSESIESRYQLTQITLIIDRLRSAWSQYFMEDQAACIPRKTQKLEADFKSAI
jgi:hypothetical protein